jgi:ferric-dicitrate binding protein FerR (iron transport regulator)
MNRNDQADTTNPDALEELLRITPVRQRPPAKDAAAIHASVHAAWRQEVHAHRGTRTRWAWAAAAVLAITLATFILRQPGTDPAPTVQLAQVEGLTGTVIARQGSEKVALNSNAGLVTGQVVTTLSDSRLTALWSGGIRLRFDQQTEFEAISTNELQLSAGRVYVDTSEATAGTSLVIITPEGAVRHIGTRYQVRVDRALTEVWVREGQVVLEPARHDTVSRVASGQRLAAQGDGSVTVTLAPTWGEVWAWVDAATPPFRIEGRSVAELLDWMARESGRSLVFASPEAQSEAKAVRLHGDLQLGVEDAVPVINETTDFRARIDGERIEVSIRKP